MKRNLTLGNFNYMLDTASKLLYL